MKTKRNFPVAYVLATSVVLAMAVLTAWQFTLPEKDPVMIMIILSGGGMLASFIVAIHKINNSYLPFAAASARLGAMLLWLGLVFLGCGLWIAIQESCVQVGIVMSAVAGLLAFFGYKTLK